MKMHEKLLKNVQMFHSPNKKKTDIFIENGTLSGIREILPTNKAAFET